MEYCSDCDIAFEGRNCPLCEALKKIEELEKYVSQLEAEEHL